MIANVKGAKLLFGDKEIKFTAVFSDEAEPVEVNLEAVGLAVEVTATPMSDRLEREWVALIAAVRQTADREPIRAWWGLLSSLEKTIVSTGVVFHGWGQEG